MVRHWWRCAIQFARALLQIEIASERSRRTLKVFFFLETWSIPRMRRLLVSPPSLTCCGARPPSRRSPANCVGRASRLRCDHGSRIDDSGTSQCGATIKPWRGARHPPYVVQEPSNCTPASTFSCPVTVCDSHCPQRISCGVCVKIANTVWDSRASRFGKPLQFPANPWSTPASALALFPL